MPQESFQYSPRRDVIPTPTHEQPTRTQDKLKSIQVKITCHSFGIREFLMHFHESRSLEPTTDEHRDVIARHNI